jgi:Acyl-CoA carboxylase epsilon subunit
MPARLRVINPDATAEEVAAIVAALSVLSAPVPERACFDEYEEWVRAARLRARRAPMSRGPWRMSGRVGRRVRP